MSLAYSNALDHHVEIAFEQSDLFSKLSGQFDIIVSNPPYIAYEDKDEVGLNVYQSEPHLALFAAENGFAIYRRIIEHASAYLTTGGKLYFEMGYKQGEGLKGSCPSVSLKSVSECLRICWVKKEWWLLMITHLIETIKAGGALILPTETVYGLLLRP